MIDRSEVDYFIVRRSEQVPDDEVLIPFTDAYGQPVLYDIENQELINPNDTNDQNSSTNSETTGTTNDYENIVVDTTIPATAYPNQPPITSTTEPATDYTIVDESNIAISELQKHIVNNYTYNATFDNSTDSIAPDETTYNTEPVPDDNEETEDDYSPEIIPETTEVFIDEVITDFSAENLATLQASGGTPYAIYYSGEEVQCEWSEIFEPMQPDQKAIYEAVDIANATNQHFWDDTNGVHVTDNEKTEWENPIDIYVSVNYPAKADIAEYYEQIDGEYVKTSDTDIVSSKTYYIKIKSFSDYSSNKPYHNILMNSLGILLRRAYYNLFSIARSGIAFYDGGGNLTNNILAMFGIDRAQIGRNTSQHAVIDANGLTVYNGDGTIAKVNSIDVVAVDQASKAANQILTGMSQAASAANTTLNGIYADAQTAKSEAQTAKTEAQTAKQAATSATTYAGNALMQLSTIQNVIDILDWVSKHKTLTTDTTPVSGTTYYKMVSGQLIEVIPFVKTNDSQPVSGKSYYTFNGVEYSLFTDSSFDSNTDYYTAQNPQNEGYYVLDQAVSSYIASHLAQTDYGLNLMIDGSNFRIHLGTIDGSHDTGLYILDEIGNPVGIFSYRNLHFGTTNTGSFDISPGSMQFKTIDDSILLNINGSNESDLITSTSRLTTTSTRTLGSGLYYQPGTSKVFYRNSIEYSMEYDLSGVELNNDLAYLNLSGLLGNLFCDGRIDNQTYLNFDRSNQSIIELNSGNGTYYWAVCSNYKIPLRDIINYNSNNKMSLPTYPINTKRYFCPAEDIYNSSDSSLSDIRIVSAEFENIQDTIWYDSSANTIKRSIVFIYKIEPWKNISDSNFMALYTNFQITLGSSTTNRIEVRRPRKFVSFFSEDSVQGDRVISAGQNNDISSDDSFIYGSSNEISGRQNYILGDNNLFNAYVSSGYVFGSDNTIGDNSGNLEKNYIIGHNNISKYGFGSTYIFGYQNKTNDNENPTSWTDDHGIHAGIGNYLIISPEQFVTGMYNEADPNKIFIIGNGTDDNNRSNIFTVDRSGNVQANGQTLTRTRVKGNSESSYRTGDVNLTPANIGAQPAGTYVNGVKGNAESSYRSGNVNLTPANIGAQPAGSYLGTGANTVTGQFTIKSTGINRDAANPSSAQSSTQFVFDDADNERIGVLRVERNTDGRVGLVQGVMSENTSGNEKSAWWRMWVARDGGITYTIPSAANFRSAIGAAASSDRRLKSDIEPLGDDAVEFIKAIEPCVYIINGEHQVGLIAQDVHEADSWGTRMAFETEEELDGLDDWEKMEDGSPTWKLDYIRLLPPTITALQKAMERIDELEKEVDILKSIVQG